MIDRCSPDVGASGRLKGLRGEELKQAVRETLEKVRLTEVRPALPLHTSASSLPAG